MPRKKRSLLLPGKYICGINIVSSFLNFPLKVISLWRVSKVALSLFVVVKFAKSAISYFGTTTALPANLHQVKGRVSMIATEEKESKVKYAWKKPTIGNLTAGLSLPLVFCLLSRRNWGFAAKNHNKHYGSQKSFTGRCLRFDRCLCQMSALCPGQKRLICITGEQGCRYSFHRKVQLRGSFKRMRG